MSDKRFDYARDQLSNAYESAAARIAWVVAQETGKHLGTDAASIRAREELQIAIESFLRR